MAYLTLKDLEKFYYDDKKIKYRILNVLYRWRNSAFNKYHIPMSLGNISEEINRDIRTTRVLCENICSIGHIGRSNVTKKEYYYITRSGINFIEKLHYGQSVR